MKNQELLTADNYFSKESQETEFEKIFSNNWFFGGMTTDLLENNSFVTLNIFDYPILIQNFKGEIKAFENICPHRFNKIQTETRGKGIFMCKYHNWSFDKNGKPKTIPQKNVFDTTCEAFDCLQVKPLKIAEVGKFLFVSLNDNVDSIDKYLGAFTDKLLEISAAINNNFYFNDDEQAVNWKIIVENVVEAYHCPAIHQETLYGMGFCRKPEANDEYDNGHSVADYPKADDAPAENKILKHLNNREMQHDTFRHYFIFPNLLISSTEATSIYIGNVLPVNSEKTILRKRFYDPIFKDNFEPKAAVHNAFLEMVKTSINQILAEDKVVLEQIQKNMKFVKKTYFLGNEEKRIADFHRKYLETIA